MPSLFFADSVAMNIITYHASNVTGMQAGGCASLVFRSGKNTDGKARQAMVGTQFFSDCTDGGVFGVGERCQKRTVPYGHGASFAWEHLLPFLLIFSTLYAALSLPLLRSGGAGSYSIRAIPFAEEPSFARALHTYIFPEQERLPSQESVAIGAEAVSAVTFKTYTVKKGDTVSGIAFRAGLRNFGTLLSVNDIGNARCVGTGTVLRIPSADGLLYTVKKNETLAGIASAYKIPVTVLLDANDLTQETLSVGQKLFIPGASLSTYELRKALGELFIYPIHGRLTSPFGYRSDPFTGAKSFHSGIDLAAPTGTSVKVTLDGKVAETGVSRIFGNYIIVSHERGYQSLYGHLSAIYVKRGQSVTQGKIIGAVGSTGYSTGPHLHLSIYKNGRVINPFSVLK